MYKDFAMLFSCMDVPSSENVRLGFYFADFNFCGLPAIINENLTPRKCPAIL